MRESVAQQLFPEGRLLLSELTHRVNNEFASAINVVSVAAARAHNGEVKVALDAVTDCFQRHALVHHALQMPEYRTQVDAAAYLRRLCLSISRATLDCKNIKLVLVDHPISMQSDRCWQLGMIVYELITNAARHAFDGRDGEIRVELFPSGSFVECRVSDNGSGPADFRPGRGLKIVEALVDGLDGRFEQRFGAQGSTTVVFFPACEYRPATTKAARMPQDRQF
ncbi:MAG: sensor histidine kinase [Xanthobacteraceae bacterium]|jgi:two-component sensor histidine kinase